MKNLPLSRKGNQQRGGRMLVAGIEAEKKGKERSPEKNTSTRPRLE